MDWSWANEEFVRQAAATVLGAILTGVFAVVSSVAGSRRAAKSRLLEDARESSRREQAQADERRLEFEGRLIEASPTIDEWLNRHAMLLVGEYGNLTSMLSWAEGMASSNPAVRIASLRAPASAQFYDLRREGLDPLLRQALMTLEVKSPSEDIRHSIQEARKDLELYYVGLAVLEAVFFKQESTQEVQARSLNMVDSRFQKVRSSLTSITSMGAASFEAIRPLQAMPEAHRRGRRPRSSR